MLELQGIAVSPGVALGKALILDREGYRITLTQISAGERENEKQRLLNAIEEASVRLSKDTQQTDSLANPEIGQIFSAHQQLLLDPMLRSEWLRDIDDQCVSAEYAVASVLSKYAQAFRRMGSETMKERVKDIRDVERTLLEALGGTPTQVEGGQEPSILLSHDLTPRETVKLNPQQILGFSTEVGGPNSHTAIVARGMEIPAVVGIGRFLHRIESDSDVIVDGFQGKIIVRPDEDTLNSYRARQAARTDHVLKLNEIRDLPAETTDGTRIKLLANIELASEIRAGLERGAEGIGLYRTEFLYLGNENEPTEAEQLTAYTDVVRGMRGLPVVMRTLDLGADKVGTLSNHEPEHNPFLGLRSIRLSLRQPKLFRVQLRAILQAAKSGPLKIMFPMITTLHELRTARMVLRQVAEDLRDEGIEVPENIEVGMMVEVPAAVLMLDHFLEEVDFISIGTNDLIQYTMAVDRGNESVADLYAGHDPAVLRLIRIAVRKAALREIDVSVCGEMSATPSTALVLIGLGIRSLSAPPAALPAVKQAIRSVTLEDCISIAERALDLGTAREVDAYLATRFAELVPQLSTGV